MIVGYSVIPLCVNVRPTTVLRTISFIAINAVQTLFWRAFSHIGEKVLKAIPFLANCYSSCAIHIEFFVLRVAASFQHTLPRNPCWRHDHAVFRNGFAVAFSAKATARCYVASLQSIASSFDRLAAIAAAVPSQVLAWGQGSPDYYEISETLAGEFVWRNHSHIIMNAGQ
jgi:hypothetical protein